MTAEIKSYAELRAKIEILEAENAALRTFIGGYAKRQAVCFGQVTAHILSQNQPLVLEDNFTEEEWLLLYAAIEQGIVSLYTSGHEISVGLEARNDFPHGAREKENSKENVLTRLRELASEGRR